MSKILKWSKGHDRNLAKDQQGAVIVEFALVALPFFLLIFATVELGFKSIVQNELDSNLYDIASTVAKTQLQGADAVDFRANRLCNDFTFVFIDCSKVTIGIQAVSGRLSGVRNDNFTGRWDLGCADDTLIIELNYPVTHFIHNFAIADIVKVNDEDHFRSRGVTRREPVLTGATTC